MTGTVDSSTTLRIRPAPPRGISTSTSPRARISTFDALVRVARHQLDDVGVQPGGGDRVAQHLDDRGVAGPRARGAAQQHRVAGLQADAGGVGGDVGPGLVDDPDHAERHPHLAELEPVGQRAAADHLADRVGQAGDVAQPLGHRRRPGPRRGAAGR